MKLFRLLAFLALFLSARAAFAEEIVTSPDGALTVTVDVNGEGRPFYRIERAGSVILADSRLGFLLSDQDKLERRLKVVGASRASHDETWEQPWGERRFVRDHHNELTVRFEENSDAKRKFGVVFRVFDDGVGFRYVFDDASMGQTLHIADELTEFNFATGGKAWWIPGGEWNRYEYLYEETPITEVSVAHTPLTMRLDDGTHVAIHEAALVDFAGMWIKRTTGTNFRATLAPTGTSSARAVRDVPFATPWRTILISADAGGLVMSDISLNLNEPNKLGDVSWFKPHKYVGVWWGMHLDEESWGSGPQHGATTANVKRYIDFAAKHGFKGVLVEGWNIGWDGDWYFNGSLFKFAEAYPDYNFEELARYSKKKGVPIIGHHETSGDIGNYESQLEAGLDMMAARGVKTVKTGYVTDACNLRYVHPDGSETRECTESQVMQRHHLKVVTEAAKRHIAVNPHEPVKDTGLRRTYPNWVAREGARGAEYDAWGEPKNLPNHVPTMIFTRLLSGPMDFTPGVLSLEGRGATPIPSTIARQLAYYVVIYSPIQMVADLPEHLEQYPREFAFIEKVPADWAQSIVLDAKVGELAVIARKDRNSESWYVGGVTDDRPRITIVKLEFLDASKTYTASIWRDGEGADGLGDQAAKHRIVIETRTVRKGDVLELQMAAAGGFAIELKPGK